MERSSALYVKKFIEFVAIFTKHGKLRFLENVLIESLLEYSETFQKVSGLILGLKGNLNNDANNNLLKRLRNEQVGKTIAIVLVYSNTN